MASRDSNEITVSVVEYADRAHYLMWYRDPITRRRVSKSTEVKRDGSKRSRTQAERVAAVWQAELREGRYAAPSKMTWAAFRERYELEVLAALAGKTLLKVSGIFNTLEDIVNPVKLADVNADKLSVYQAKLRERGKSSEDTIRSHMAHLQAALNWAVKIGMLHEAPAIVKPKRAKGSKVMKGRPITREEFERMLAKMPSVVLGAKSKPHADRIVESWRHYLEGLMASGLRLAESLELTWDQDDKLRVDFTGKHPMLRIPAELEKGNETRVLPMAPEFAEFLEQTPADQRTGYVFNPLPKFKSARVSAEHAGKVISKIGKLAVVKTCTAHRTGKVKSASAHDLRRSFGERWASRVMPQVLMELMRHENIETTLKYYVGRNAQATADVLWQAHERASNSLGNNSADCQRNGKAETNATPFDEKTL